MTTDHRAEAEEWLATAEEWWKESDATVPALFAIAHALLAHHTIPFSREQAVQRIRTVVENHNQWFGTEIAEEVVETLGWDR